MSSDKPVPGALRHVRPSDLRAAAQLAATATHGVIDLTESVHQSVRRRLWPARTCCCSSTACA